MTTETTNLVPFNVIDDAGYKNLLKNFRTAQTKFQKLAHELSLQAIAKAAVHDDSSKITNLYLTLEKQAHQDMFETWIERFTPWKKRESEEGVSFRKNNKKVKEKKAEIGEDDYDDSLLYDFEGALQLPFLSIDLKTESEDNLLKKLGLMDYHKKIDQMIKEIEKAEAGEAKNKELEEQDRDNIVQFKNSLKALMQNERDAGRGSEAA